MKPRLAYALLVFFIVSGLLVGVILINKNKNAACSEAYRQDLTVRYAENTLSAQRASSDVQRQQGLSGKRCIGENQAMLFTFDKPGYYPFWMKDMKFPIDIIWLNSAHQVVYLQPDVAPSSYPQTFSNTDPAVAVLELKNGRAAELGIGTGSQLYY